MIKTLLFDFMGVISNPQIQNYSDAVTTVHKEIFPKDPYYFINHYELNQELLEYIKTKNNKFELAIYTSMVLSTETELNKKLAPIFSKIFSAAELGLEKKDPRSYEAIIKSLNKNPDEVLFIDDTRSNLEAAKEAGLITHMFTDNSEIIKYINSLNE